MEKRKLVAALTMAVLLIPVVAAAQVLNFDMRYDPRTATTITGNVLATIDYDPGNPLIGPQGVVLASKDQIYTVFLGPGWFVRQSGLKLMHGDPITVTGSIRTVGGRQYLVASLVSTPSATYTFRSQTGTPRWAGAPVISPPPIGRGPEGAPTVMFDPNRLGSASGWIIQTRLTQTVESASPYVLAEIRPVSGHPDRVRILLGPQNYLDQLGMDLNRGDYLAAQGSFVEFGGQRTLVASSVLQDAELVTLRTSVGAPVWPVAVPSTQLAPIPPPPIQR